MVFLFSIKLISKTELVYSMLGANVMRITLVYAEKVKFISFTLRPSNLAFGAAPDAVPGAV
ncbi:MAG: hypothetical protein ABWY04_13320 [Arthrobacter sp.]